MQVRLRQADTDRLEELEPLVAAYHEFEAIPSDQATRRAALCQLLGDSRLGAIWLVYEDDELAGYIALCRGFSIEFSGFDAFIDEFFLLPEFRGRGIGKRVLEEISEEAQRLDINALHLEVARDNAPARRLYRGAGFEAREKYVLMSRMLAGKGTS
jgi:ribosomal protein S18 acetylase RimI-like enzyme